MEQIESPEINAYIYGQLILTRMLRQSNGKRIFFSTSSARTTGYPRGKK